jgi:heat-inducible transcriptional repressor
MERPGAPGDENDRAPCCRPRARERPSGAAGSDEKDRDPGHVYRHADTLRRTESGVPVDCEYAAGYSECWHSHGESANRTIVSSLDTRSRAILKEIIRVHVDTGKPVSSRTLFKSHRFSLSPASIRNIMADLTDGGYLAQPHTSAGRVPTDRAYRLYIDELVRHRRVNEDLREQVDSDLASAGPEVTGLFQTASRLLSRLSGEVGFVVAPDSLHTVLKSLRFLSVAPGKVLVVQVNEPDIVLSRVIEVGDGFSARELEAASERFTREYAGRTLHEVRARLLAELSEEKAAYDRMISRSLELGRLAFGSAENEGRVYVDGAAKLLDKPEFSDVESLKRIFRAFDEKARLLDLVTRYLDSKQTCVVLGSEASLASDPRLSAVLTSFGPGETLTGMLGVIGPARREYPRVIPVVELLGRALTDRLESRESRARRAQHHE